MPELVIDGDRRLIVAGAFRLAFTWTGERWVHSIEHRARDAAAHRVLAISVEGDPERDDPARVVSPAYQDLQFQEAERGLQALLVGQSGPHHFSAVFYVIEGIGQVSVVVDVADRCRAPVETLASTYTVAATSGDLVEARDDAIRWHLVSDTLSFCVVPGAWDGLAWAEAGRRATRIQALARIDPSTSTQRLRYAWNWLTDEWPF